MAFSVLKSRQIIAISLVTVLSASLFLLGAMSLRPDAFSQLQPSAVSFSAALTIPHAEFNITSDEEFSGQGWPGNGTTDAPYRIENLSISGINYGILVANTTKCFVVEGCEIDSPTGIVLSNVSHGSIVRCNFTTEHDAIIGERVIDCRFEYNRITSFLSAISLYDVKGTALLQNVIWGARVGVSAVYASDCDIGYNNISDFSLSAFRLHIAYNTGRIHDNLIQGVLEMAHLGFQISSLSGWHIEDNRISYCEIGLQLYGSSGTVVNRNELSNCSYDIWLNSCCNMTLSSNRLDGGVTGIGAASSRNLLVVNNTILQTTLAGISLHYCTRCVIEGNVMTRGLAMWGDSPSHWKHTVVENAVGEGKIGYFTDLDGITVKAGDYRQVILLNCTSVVVENGDFFDCTYGAFIGWSHSCIVTDCSIHDNFYEGLILRHTVNCSVTYNSLNHNSDVYDGGGGLGLEWADHTIISHNVVYANRGSGIILDYDTPSDHTLICSNIITNNTEYGVLVGGTSRNTVVYANVVGWNGLNNSLDLASDTQWDDGISLGNWWSDYNGTGPYVPFGESGNVDHFPRLVTTWSTQLPLSNGQWEWSWIVASVAAVALVGVGMVAAVDARRRREAA